MTTKTSTPETKIWIQWTNDYQIIQQFKSISEFSESVFPHHYANNFGYDHLLDNVLDRWSHRTVHNIFIVSADPTYNYGLDFKIYIHYTADDINFFKEFNMTSSITSAPLIRVMLSTKIPTGLNLTDLKSNSEELMNEWFSNIKNDIYSSFRFSTNAFYSKAEENRNTLRELSKSSTFIFA